MEKKKPTKSKKKSVASNPLGVVPKPTNAPAEVLLKFEANMVKLTGRPTAQILKEKLSPLAYSAYCLLQTGSVLPNLENPLAILAFQELWDKGFCGVNEGSPLVYPVPFSEFLEALVGVPYEWTEESYRIGDNLRLYMGILETLPVANDRNMLASLASLPAAQRGAAVLSLVSTAKVNTLRPGA